MIAGEVHYNFRHTLQVLHVCNSQWEEQWSTLLKCESSVSIETDMYSADHEMGFY